jgi:hypothetical protein
MIRALEEKPPQKFYLLSTTVELRRQYLEPNEFDGDDEYWEEYLRKVLPNETELD